MKKSEEKIDCCFSKELYLAYRGTYNQGDKTKRLSVSQYYYCDNFYARKHRFEQHTENCSGFPSVVYNFNN